MVIGKEAQTISEKYNYSILNSYLLWFEAKSFFFHWFGVLLFFGFGFGVFFYLKVFKESNLQQNEMEKNTIIVSVARV